MDHSQDSVSLARCRITCECFQKQSCYEHMALPVRMGESGGEQLRSYVSCRLSRLVMFENNNLLVRLHEAPSSNDDSTSTCIP